MVETSIQENTNQNIIKQDEKSKSYEEFLKKNKEEIKRIVDDYNHRISKAGLEELLILIWTKSSSDREAIKKVRSLLKKLLRWGSVLGPFKAAPTGLKGFLASLGSILKKD